MTISIPLCCICYRPVRPPAEAGTHASSTQVSLTMIEGATYGARRRLIDMETGDTCAECHAWWIERAAAWKAEVTERRALFHEQTADLKRLVVAQAGAFKALPSVGFTSQEEQLIREVERRQQGLGAARLLADGARDLRALGKGAASEGPAEGADEHEAESLDDGDDETPPPREDPTFPLRVPRR